MTHPNGMSRRISAAVVAVALIFATVACQGGDNNGKKKPKKTTSGAFKVGHLDVEEPTGRGMAPGPSGAFDVVDKDAYTYRISFQASLGAATSEVEDQAPGEAKIVIAYQNSGITKNTTSQRQAPVAPGGAALRVFPLWKEGSRVCETIGEPIDDPVFDSNHRPFCILPTAGGSIHNESAMIPPDGSVEFNTSTPLTVEGLEEAKVPALLKDLENGPVGWIAGYGGTIIPVEADCYGGNINVLWKSADLGLASCPTKSEGTPASSTGDNQKQALAALESVLTEQGETDSTFDCPATPLAPLKNTIESIVQDDLSGSEAVVEKQPNLQVRCVSGSSLSIAAFKEPAAGRDARMKGAHKLLGGDISASSEFRVAGGQASVYCQDINQQYCRGYWHNGTLAIESAIGGDSDTADAQAQLNWIHANAALIVDNMAHHDMH